MSGNNTITSTKTVLLNEAYKLFTSENENVSYDFYVVHLSELSNKKEWYEINTIKPLKDNEYTVSMARKDSGDKYKPYQFSGTTKIAVKITESTEVIEVDNDSSQVVAPQATTTTDKKDTPVNVRTGEIKVSSDYTTIRASDGDLENRFIIPPQAIADFKSKQSQLDFKVKGILLSGKPEDFIMMQRICNETTVVSALSDETKLSGIINQI